MSLISVSPNPAGSTYPAGASSPIYCDRAPTETMIDPKTLEWKLNVLRNNTPFVGDWTGKLKANAYRHYDQLRALGGRPTRPINQYPYCKTDAADGKTFYRDEYEKMEVIFEVDERRSSDHWGEEAKRCGLEKMEWEGFKENQRTYNQNGRSELELELENTDIALVDALSKLNDWQEFQSIYQRRVHDAEMFVEEGQQGNANTYNAMVTATNTSSTFNIQEPFRGWLRYTKEAQEELEIAKNELAWVKSQWTEVISEACSTITAVPKLQKQLEAKLERQTRAIYSALQQKGARPSHAICAPNEDAEFPQRVQHWISETSVFTAELRNWKVFLAWRQHVRDADNVNQEGEKLHSETEVDSSSELYKDLVKYQQHELDKAISWAKSWRLRVRKYEKAIEDYWLYRGIHEWREGVGWIRPRMESWEYDSHDDGYLAESKRAEIQVKRAEEKVFNAAKRLEQLKKKLKNILAESGSSFTDETTAALAGTETPPTPTSSPSPEHLRKSRAPSKQRGPGGKGHRRSKKVKARKLGGKVANANTEQHALPKFLMGSNHQKENENDIEMSDDADDSCPIEIEKESNQETSEDTVMSDIEKSASQLPLTPPQSQPEPISNTNHRKLPSSSSQPLTSRKTRSATKLDQVPSGKVHKKPNTNKPPKKSKTFTEQQKKVLLDAASTDCPSVVPTTLGRSEAESHSTPPTNTNYGSIPSPDSSDLPSRRSQPIPKIDRSPTGKIHKKPNKDKPRKKAKKFTEAQTKTLLDAASANCPPTSHTPPEKAELKSYSMLPISINFNTSSSSSSSGSSPRNIHSTLEKQQPFSNNINKISNEDKPRKEVGSLTEDHQSAALDTASTGLSSAGPTPPGNPESKSHPTPLTSTNSDTLSSANTSTSPPRNPPSISTPETNQPPSNKPHKNTNENKPRKKVKNYTEEQTKGASDAASTSPAKIRRIERLKQKAAAGKRRE